MLRPALLPALRSCLRPAPKSVGGAGPSYDPDAEALFAKFNNHPSSAVKAAYNDFLFVPLKTTIVGGVALYDKLDTLHVWDTLDPQWARQNLRGKTPAAGFVSSPAHTPKQGVQGDGSMSYVDLNYNPGNGGLWKYTQDNGHAGLWSLTDASQSSVDMGSRATSNTQQSVLLLRVSNNYSSRLNISSGAFNIPVPNSLGYHTGVRESTNSMLAFKDSALVGTSSIASAPLFDGNWYLGAANQGGSAAVFASRQYRASHAGAAFALEDHQAMRTILDNWHTAISSIV